MNRPTEIDLIGIPFDLGAGRRGSAGGPEALRRAGLPMRLRDLGWRVRDEENLLVRLTGREALDVDLARCGNHAGAVAAWTQAIEQRAHAATVAGLLPVFMGGDHSISMGTVGGVARACAEQGKVLSVIWLDAHADYNTPETTHTGNLHGMAVAFLTGHASLRSLLGGRPVVAVAPQRVHLLGLRDVDRAEQLALDASGIDAVPMRQGRVRGLAEVVRGMLAGLDPATTHLHVSLDLDVVEPSLAPGVGTPVPEGADLHEIRTILSLLAGSGLVRSVDLVELDPTLDPGGGSADLLADLACTLLGPAP